MTRWGTGASALNFMGAGGASPDAVRAAYSVEDYRRLVRVKRAYDPDNLFRANHNILPHKAVAAQPLATR